MTSFDGIFDSFFLKNYDVTMYRVGKKSLSTTDAATLLAVPLAHDLFQPDFSTPSSSKT
jgi:hypothetical protein